MTATAPLTQRWHHRSSRWRRTTEGGFNPDQFHATPVDAATAREFTLTHHYSSSWPSVTRQFGLYDIEADSPSLVGIAAYGVPMSRGVLTLPFPTLDPYRESLELSRLVLREEVPANAESWFCARTFTALAQLGVRGIVAFSDPVPRWRTSRSGVRELIKPGHCGIVYQALGFHHLGLGTPRTLVLLPDATSLPARAIAKVVGRERGAGGVIRRLVALGAEPPADAADRSEWIHAALAAIGATKVRHPGNHRYAVRIGRTRSERARVTIALPPHPYPKPADRGRAPEAGSPPVAATRPTKEVAND